jgi:hypothetical protein
MAGSPAWSPTGAPSARCGRSGRAGPRSAGPRSPGSRTPCRAPATTRAARRDAALWNGGGPAWPTSPTRLTSRACASGASGWSARRMPNGRPGWPPWAAISRTRCGLAAASVTWARPASGRWPSSGPARRPPTAATSPPSWPPRSPPRAGPSSPGAPTALTAPRTGGRWPGAGTPSPSWPAAWTAPIRRATRSCSTTSPRRAPSSANGRPDGRPRACASSSATGSSRR